VVGEIARVEQTVALLHVRGDGGGDRPFVERVTAAPGDQPQRRREVRVREDVARRGRVAVREKRRGRRRID
jgi:hypothetical protein